MNTYIVRVQSPKVRNELEKYFEKVGNPKSLKKTIIVETNKSKHELEQFYGVIKVKENVQIELGEIQQDPKNWALPKICNETDNL